MTSENNLSNQQSFETTSQKLEEVIRQKEDLSEKLKNANAELNALTLNSAYYEFLCKTVWQKRGDSENTWEVGMEIVMIPPEQEQKLRETFRGMEAVPDPT